MCRKRRGLPHNGNLEWTLSKRSIDSNDWRICIVCEAPTTPVPALTRVHRVDYASQRRVGEPEVRSPLTVRLKLSSGSIDTRPVHGVIGSCVKRCIAPPQRTHNVALPRILQFDHRHQNESAIEPEANRQYANKYTVVCLGTTTIE